MHLPRRRGNQRRPRSNPQHEAGDRGASNVGWLDALVTQQLLIHEETVEKDVQPALIPAFT